MPMTRIQVGDAIHLIPDEQWEQWVREGRIPPDAWVLSPFWTEGNWRRAESMEVYHLFLPSRSDLHERQAPGITDVIFSRKGLSVTEALALANLLVTAALFVIWRSDYEPHLWWLAQFLRRFVGDGRGFYAAIIPLFLHASPQHVFYNVVALVGAGSIVEYFYGKRKMIAGYLLSGYGGAALSFFARPKPTLSVGASGAIFGLYGLCLFLLLRHYGKFSVRQKWKTTRIYIPILVLAVIPAIFGGDFYSHLGGFLTGCAIGLFLPAGPRVAFLYSRPLPPPPSPIEDTV
jgi:membrane associated rhomboid family serine protease